MAPRSIAQLALPSAALLMLTPWISSGAALVGGVAFALTIGNPYAALTKQLTHTFLSLAVVGLGAGMDLRAVGQVGAQGIGYTVVGIVVATITGLYLGRRLGTARDTSLLITMGTAICGGSAIAAIAPVIKARPHEVSVALGTVFLLNAVALFVFPWVGHHLDLSQTHFGLWCALAIHDTSSVVGAALQYGSEALAIGTTVKLARALWIIPVATLIGMVRAKQSGARASADATKRPWFILGFIIAAGVVTWIPATRPAGHLVEAGAKRLMVLTLFLIGTNLSRETLRAVGVKPFVQGLGLWVVMAAGSLAGIWFGLIR